MGETDLDAWSAFLSEPVVGIVSSVLALEILAYVWWKFYRPVRNRRDRR